MATPLFSTLSAVTELGVTAAVYTFLFSAYYRDRFRSGLLAFALVYEVLVNIAYMTFRLVAPAEGVEYADGLRSLLAFHGTLSLLMFLGLVAISIQAIREHRSGRNLFRERPGLTGSFAALWAVSILTGEIIYVILYV